MKILVTGFNPFLGEIINPSQILAEELSRTEAVDSLVLPVEFQNAFNVLSEHLVNNKYDYVLMLGQAASRKNICFEKIALNWVQTNFADEAGCTPLMGAILPSMPLAVMTSFPVDRIYQKLKDQGEPVDISFSAGTFVCNELYFKVLMQHSDMNSVFIHVPLVKEQVETLNERPFVEQERQLVVMRKVISELRSEQ